MLANMSSDRILAVRVFEGELERMKMKEGGKTKKKATPKQKAQYKASMAYQIKTGRTNKKKGEDLVDKVKKGYEFTTKTAPRRAARVAMGDPIAKRKYGAGDVFNQFTEKATRMKEGGKTKSRVNEAGNYTKPGMRKQIFNRICPTY